MEIMLNLHKENHHEGVILKDQIKFSIILNCKSRTGIDSKKFWVKYNPALV